MAEAAEIYKKERKKEKVRHAVLMKNVWPV